MSLAYKRQSMSLIGNLVFLIVVVIVVYLFVSFVYNYQINKIHKINAEFVISSNQLIPENTDDYRFTLKELNIKYTEPIIEYIDLMNEAKRIERYLEYSQFETGCVTRTTLTKIEMQIQNKELLLRKFGAYQSRKLEKIHWSEYVVALENFDIERTKEKAQELDMC